MITKDLKLHQFLSKNEKFDLSGFLSSEIIINQNEELQSASAKIITKNLVLNQNLNIKITKFETERFELLARLERLEKVALGDLKSKDLATIKLP